MPLTQQRLDLEERGLGLGGSGRRHDDPTDRVSRRSRRVPELAPHGGVRHQDHVILILTHLALPLASQHPQHLTGEGSHPHVLAHRIVVAEQLIDHAATEQADLGGRDHVLIGEGAA